MQGTGFFYDTKLGRKILAYKLLIGAISDGRFMFPLFFSFIFDKDLLSDQQLQDKDAIIQPLIWKAFELFGKNRVIVVADGAFATIKFLKWSIEKNIKVEVRMHSNRKVLFKGKLIAIRDIKELKLKGRQMARTIKVIWHDIELYITA